MRKEIIQIICDSCGETDELVGEQLPSNWISFIITECLCDTLSMHTREVCSLICAEMVAVFAIRNQFENSYTCT